MANNNIHIKVGADYKELTGLIKTTDQTKRSLDLVSKSFARTGDQKAWMSGINQIVAAQKKLEASSRMSRSEIMKLAYQYKQSAQFSDALSKATGKLAGATGQMGRRMSRSGVMFQQAGYQIGDFIVQAQSGQNVMVAFGQQATQMAGTLTMLGGKFIGIGTVLGIAIPLATAFGAALMRTSESSKKASGGIKTLEDRLKSLDRTLQDWVLTKKAASLGITLDELIGSQSLEGAQNKLKDAQDFLKKAKEGGGSGFADIGRQQADLSVERAEEKVRLATERLVKVQARLREESVSSYNEEKRLLEQKVSLLTMTERFGKDSLAVREQEKLHALENYRVELERGKIDKTRHQSLIDRLSLQIDLANQLQDQEAAAKAVDEAFKETQASLKTLVGQSSNLDVEIAKAKAQIEALKNNTDVATAAYIAGERAKITATYETTKALAIQNGNMIVLAENALAYAEAMGKLETLKGLKTTLSGMKGDAKASKSNPLLDLQKRIALDTKLLGVSREQAQVERAIANSKIKYSDQEIANTVKELEAYNLKLDKMKETQALYGTMQSSLESGFMAMVDGTKSVEDAFKDMAKQVIAELYRVLVVQRMVGSFESGTGIMGMIGGIFGGAPTSSIRPQMRPSSFDGGGYTGSGPRSGGMDGRGGYLAMMHPRETVIDHTKAGSAGGGESVTVVNNFNFQANGDDSVKRIIAQAAPSIANMAKQSVMDSRRRGGAMKNTFG